jgi:hypothetical protein
MTVMQSSETRFNLILSIGLTVIGLLLWGFGLQAVARNTLLPDYAAALRGCAGVLVLLGLVWLALAAIRSLESLSNLAASCHSGLWFSGSSPSGWSQRPLPPAMPSRCLTAAATRWSSASPGWSPRSEN